MKRLPGLITLVLLALSASAVNALPITERILETAPLGTTNGGTSILDTQFLGARFTLTDRYFITGVGGHVKSNGPDNDRSIFVAIVPTLGPDFFPSDTSLSDAIFATSFEAPFNNEGPYPYQVNETIIRTHFFLQPGTYAIVFGSGLFGATGNGWMPVSGPTQELPWFFSMNRYIGDYFRNLDEQPVRFVVEGRQVPVPEPTTMLLLASGLVALVGLRKRFRNL